MATNTTKRQGTPARRPKAQAPQAKRPAQPAQAQPEPQPQSRAPRFQEKPEEHARRAQELRQWAASEQDLQRRAELNKFANLHEAFSRQASPEPEPPAY